MHTLVKQILFGNFEGGHTPPEEILQNRKHSDLTLLKAEMCLWTRNIRIMFFEDKQNHLIVWASEGHAKANFLCSKVLAFAYFNTNGRFLEHISTYHRGFPNLYPSGTQAKKRLTLDVMTFSAGLILCKLGGYISILSVSVSVFTLVAISVDRFLHFQLSH